ncbi:hypothetical protein ASPZODRAFT_74987 [Penicilliopsis zonata CBS 506.65]|uniref:Phospholipid-transporting ATPase n=1 Tax=Penicilliopsis zonata CBS 506.65 TaxID=1073090 RepID=A0A1L9S7K3_9EURO|nr:hypothetical protein ASPZODRAFT_74987 [Penicilliopsis zonata CBS 506.65]OJJ43140.1 hypothetical protein ASPZODRAFT_74987 [Penicilliopsis zonata CBS 506.65]
MTSIRFDAAEEAPGNEVQETNSRVSKPTKRQRWATQRESGAGGVRKRVSIIDRFHKRSEIKEEKRQSGASFIPSLQASEPASGKEQKEQQQQQQQPQNRTIYFNTPVPESERDEEGHLLAVYPRNKIRTAKYTPLSFIPKNIWLQFHNIANDYFLFVIILNFFPIFGANNPGLNAVPLIVIITATAIKDAIEDWRRTVLDNELNNSPVYRLMSWHNVNSVGDEISAWRRFKKACTHSAIYVYKQIASLTGKGKTLPATIEDERRASFMTTVTPRTSVAYSNRASMFSHRGGGGGGGGVDPNEGAIQMTPVPSPNPEVRESWPLPDDGIVPQPRPDDNNKPAATAAARASTMFPQVSPGSILDRSKQTSGTARFKRDFWKNIEVGDFVRIYSGDQIPADIVIMSTSDPDGACYVETKNLDGETNLKVRQALNCSRPVRHARDCEKTEFTIDSEAPHPNLYSYNGAIRWEQADYPDGPRKDRVEPISINNLLLRGCSLRNTEWVLGVVVFTGVETKIMLNSGETPTKRARLFTDMVKNVIYNFIILFLMCLVSGIINGVSWGNKEASLDFFDFGSYGGTPPVTGVVTFWVAVILFQNLVPISLFISLEIVRTVQAIFIHSDVHMYYEKLGIACVPKTWNISDDVGQIEYIFSDKTGTLTQNVMEFKKCTINGVSYGEAYTEAQLGMQRRAGINVDEEAARAAEQIRVSRIRMLELLREMHNNPYLHDDKLTFVSPDMISDMGGRTGEAQQAAIEHFMLALAVCHTVITEHTPGDPPQIEFKAQSPDEAALVATARDCGFTVLGRSGDDLTVNVLGQERTYTVLNTLEFNSSRKRMSAIIRMPDGSIRLFCKGADSVIYSRLARGQQQELRKSTADHLEMFAREGLRTLCIADRELSEEYYQTWSREHDVAAAAISEREEKLEKVASEIEQELNLLGGTAIEDRLQDGVPDTISLLADAGIKLWVLTGDKVETAINIGFSCNLLTNDMELLVFNVPENELDLAENELDKNLQIFGLTGSDEELIAARKDHTAPAPTHAVVIDGDTLKLMLSDKLKQKFLLLCKQCKSVLCCRVSPAQKAAVVNMVRNGLNIMALSIGDGANDVAMIQEADVGVGIAGEEGRQAVMSSDYAIGQFRFLQRLVLVHGRWSYRRLGETIANFFYKNLVWTFALFWYSIYNNFDGSYLFDYTYIVLVNLAFTSLPVIFMGIFDQDVDDKVSLAVPQLYMRGIERKEWSQLKFWLYMGDGLYQSAICFFMPYLLYSPANFIDPNGRDLGDRNRMGVLVATCAIIASNTYVLFNMYRWDWLSVLINAISSLLVFFWTGVYTCFTSSGQFYQAAPQVYGALSFWAVLLVTVAICLLPRFFIKSVQKVYFPRDVDIIRELVSLGHFKHLDRFEAYVPPNAGVTGVTGANNRGVNGLSGDSATSSSDMGKPIEQPPIKRDHPALSEEERPIYPPSVAPTANTHNQRSQNGSNGTNYTSSFDMNRHPRPQSIEFARASYDRPRPSMDRARQSFEASNDFTSAAMLSRIESSHTNPQPPTSPHGPLRGHRDPIAVP